MKRLAIVGAGGHGKVVADTAYACGWEGIVFFDDSVQVRRGEFSRWPVVGDTEALLSQLLYFDGVLVAIGNNRVRLAKLQQLQAVGARIPRLVHPAAVVSDYASLGAGTVAFAGAVVNVDAVVGIGTILNTGCSVDHDCILGKGVHISPGARLGGNVVVGECSWVGIGASVRHGIHLGDDVVVGTGAAVVKAVPNGMVVAGVPAQELRRQL